MTHSPWALEYARRPDEYVLGTSPSGFARALGALVSRQGRVLELGCGEGRDAVFFASRGADVTAVEISAAGLRKAARLARARGVRVRWIRASIARCPLDGPFDLILSYGVLHYLPRGERRWLFRRLQAVTNPGGIHAHLVFTDRLVYREKSEVADYFRAGELASHYRRWRLLRGGPLDVPCAQDGTRHRHGAEVLVARAPGTVRRSSDPR
jgi:tellurite methyltransferase